MLVATIAEEPPPSPDPWVSLKERIEKHVDLMHTQAHLMFMHFCRPTDPESHKKSFARGEVSVPSCPELRDAGMEQYYGNVNLLLAEAWSYKILDETLTRLAPLSRRPAASLQIVREPYDSMVAGGIFVSQLFHSRDAHDNGESVLADAALMIGIHRAPRHKMIRRLGRTPDINVTNELVAAAQRWTIQQQLSTLLVCPLNGDGGSLRARLVALGFVPEEESASPVPRFRLGEQDLRNDVCEEAKLMVFHAADQAGSPKEQSEDNKSEL